MSDHIKPDVPMDGPRNLAEAIEAYNAAHAAEKEASRLAGEASHRAYEAAQRLGAFMGSGPVFYEGRVYRWEGRAPHGIHVEAVPVVEASR